MIPTLEIQPKPERKVTVSVRLSSESVALLDAAVERSGKTQSSIVNECVGAVLSAQGGKAKK